VAVVREREAVLELINSSETGLKQNELRRVYETRMGKPIAYRTLRRRLEELEAAGLITRSRRGNNPAFRSSASPEPEPGKKSPQQPEAEPRIFWQAAGSPAPDGEGIAEIPISAEAATSLALVRRPRAQRSPATYESQFLDAYQPGQSWYLSDTLRDHLRSLGTTAYADQPAGTYARESMQRLLIDLSWGSSRLEGNKYSRIDTQELIEGGKEAAGASDLDRQMILNHKAAIEFLVENAAEIEFNRYTVFSLHALLGENLLGNAEDEGRLRTRGVEIGSSVFTPTAVPQIIEERFDTILAKARAIPDPLEQSFFVMVHLPYLQPFIDVNKRTSRLAANIPLIKANLCPLSFVDVPEEAYNEGTLAIYEQNDVALLRDVYTWAYERSCTQFAVLRKAMGAPDPIRLNYRTQLRAIVAEVVAERIWPADSDLLGRAVAQGIPEGDQAGFVAAARRDLQFLRADILGRYQILPSQFAAWREAVGNARDRV